MHHHALSSLDLFSFFTLGLMGGFGHCLGMCHPFVLFISGRFAREKKGYWRLFFPQIQYNLGRIITYAILGLILGFLGELAHLRGRIQYLQKILAIIAGAILVIYAITSFGGFNFFAKAETKSHKFNLNDIFKRYQPNNPMVIGLILGLLPCGFIYSVLVGTLVFSNAFMGSLAMVLFGFGTMFALLGFALIGNFIMRRRDIFNIISLIVMLVMGGRFIYMGAFR
jgi:hypothetical protein